jgi:type VI secretion system protein ImpJ
VEIINLVQRNTKIGPVGKIEMLVDAAMAGLGLVPESNPPGSVPVKAGYKYFRLVQTGEHWDEILRTGTFAIHIPQSLPGLKLEVTATLSSSK